MVQHCFADNASFNEKPHVEPKKRFSAKYVGCIDVPKPTGLTALFVECCWFVCLLVIYSESVFVHNEDNSGIWKIRMCYMLQRNNMSFQISVRCVITRFICDTIMSWAHALLGSAKGSGANNVKCQAACRWNNYFNVSEFVGMSWFVC